MESGTLINTLLRYTTLDTFGGGGINLVVWQSISQLPNLNPPIFLRWRFGAQPPNLIPTNISSYMVFILVCIYYCSIGLSQPASDEPGAEWGWTGQWCCLHCQGTLLHYTRTQHTTRGMHAYSAQHEYIYSSMFVSLISCLRGFALIFVVISYSRSYPKS